MSLIGRVSKLEHIFEPDTWSRQPVPGTVSEEVVDHLAAVELEVWWAKWGQLTGEEFLDKCSRRPDADELLDDLDPPRTRDDIRAGLQKAGYLKE